MELARAESELGELVLRTREEVDGTTTLELRANGVFVMDTAETTSERALARAALDRHDHAATVLVGGLGLGFTLAEVLTDARVRRVVVAEIEPSLVAWMRDGTVPHGPALMDDDRLEVVVGDVREVIATADNATYDLVLLDVDNGPGHLVHEANRELYGQGLLRSIRRSLAPHGIVAIWSASHDEALHEGLAAELGDVEVAAYDVALQDRTEQYWLHLARVGSTSWTGL